MNSLFSIAMWCYRRCADWYNNLCGCCLVFALANLFPRSEQLPKVTKNPSLNLWGQPQRVATIAPMNLICWQAIYGLSLSQKTPKSHDSWGWDCKPSSWKQQLTPGKTSVAQRANDAACAYRIALLDCKTIKHVQCKFYIAKLDQDGKICKSMRKCTHFRLYN